jgi:ribosomal protein S18 acetylase RimI-like enzyme
MAPITLDFQPATADDAPQIQQLVQAAFRTDDSRPNWTGNTELASNFHLSVDEVLAQIANPAIVSLKALDASSPQHPLVASIDVSLRGDAGRLSMIAVDDSYQRAGLGRRVLEYAEGYCRRTWGVAKFSLNALSTRPALIAWYERRGYRRTGETSPFPVERFPNMKLPADMCFIELEKDFGDAAGEGASV